MFPECRLPFPICTSSLSPRDMYPALFPSISQTQIQKSQPSLCHSGPQWRDLQFHSRSKRNSRMQGAISHLHFLISLGIHPSNRMREMQMGNRSLHSRASDRCQRSEWKKQALRKGRAMGEGIRSGAIVGQVRFRGGCSWRRRPHVRGRSRYQRPPYRPRNKRSH
jgi:hypothetical protein